MKRTFLKGFILKSTTNQGFTLIELLVVIGVLAVVASGVVALINPQDKLRQASDTKIQNDVGQLSTALQSYAAQRPDGSYPCATGGAASCSNPATANGVLALGPDVAGGGVVGGTNELTRLPLVPAGYPVLAGANYGFASNPIAGGPVTEAIVYGTLMSGKYTSRCTGAGAIAFWGYSTAIGSACGFCGTAADLPDTTDFDTSAECDFN